MSLTSGFFNSLNGDRKYDAVQFSSIFDGLIIDGIFASVGSAFAVKAAGGLNLTVGTGKAWFKHTWTVNDALLPLTAPSSEVLLNRIDAVVLEINSTASVRCNSIEYVKGSPATSPARPTMLKSDEISQYPLCYIYRKAGSTAITQSNITPMIGSSSTPFVTGILQTISLDDLLGKWQDELDSFISEKTEDIDSWTEAEKSEVTEFVGQIKSDLQSEQKLIEEWVSSEQTDFLAWYEQMKGQLSEDAAGNLQLEIDDEKVRRILTDGLEDGVKKFSDDGTVIVTTASDGRTLTKTFTDNFTKMTAVLKSAAGADIATMTKVFSDDGKTITTVIIPADSTLFDASTTDSELWQYTVYTVTKKYFAVSYVMKNYHHTGKTGDNGCCGIVLNGDESNACVYMTYNGASPSNELYFGPWWNTTEYGSAAKSYSISVTDDANVTICGEISDGKATYTGYFNGVENGIWGGGSSFTGSFNGKIGWATKLSNSTASLVIRESDKPINLGYI